VARETDIILAIADLDTSFLNLCTPEVGRFRIINDELKDNYEFWNYGFDGFDTKPLTPRGFIVNF